MKYNQRRRASGFTLMETSLATVIIGTGVLAIMSAQQAYLRKNVWAQRTGTAVLLANELRELTLSLPMHDPITPDTMGPEADEGMVTIGGVNQFTFDDVDDFAGVIAANLGQGTTFDPPINAMQQEVAGMNGWSQVVRVENVLVDNVGAVAAQPIGTTPMMRVNVAVRFLEPGANNPTTIAELTWVVGED